MANLLKILTNGAKQNGHPAQESCEESRLETLVKRAPGEKFKNNNSRQWECNEECKQHLGKVHLKPKTRWEDTIGIRKLVVELKCGLNWLKIISNSGL